jgi:uncharacterized membrane protein
MVRLALRYPLRLNRLEELWVLVGRREDASGRAFSRIGRRLVGVGLVVLGVLVAWWAFKGYWVLVTMVPLLALATALMVQPRWSDEQRFVLFLVFTGFLVLVGIEFFYLKDHLDGDQLGWWRMNTLFKFYLQVWVMLGVAVGASLPVLWGAMERGARRRPIGVWTWRIVLSLLLVAVLLYPLLGTPARVMDRFPGARPPIGTLDGMAFMTVGRYTWPDDQHPIDLWGDYEAIRWLQENVRGTPILAEAPIGYYREFGVRASSFTGLPTLVGMHANEQRWGWQVARQSAQARQLYTTVDVDQTMDILSQVRIEYVYLGPLERIEYPQAAAKFEYMALSGLLEVAYQNELVTIYRVT